MLLLAMDTSTSAITVALHDGTRLLASHTVVDPVGHAEHLAPGIADVLTTAGAAPADVTNVACGRGPGPFTGLRVGIVTARVFALATGARLCGVGSLDVLAHQAWRAGMRGPLLVATDARRKEVYAARYDLGAAGAERCTEPQVCRPDDLAAESGGGLAVPVVGRGARLYPQLGRGPEVTGASVEGASVDGDDAAAGNDAAAGGDVAAGGDAAAGGDGLLDVSAAALADLVVRRLAATSDGAGAAADDLADVEPMYLRRPDALTTADRISAGGAR